MRTVDIPQKLAEYMAQTPKDSASARCSIFPGGDVVQVCAQMGHADVSITLKIYTHLGAVHKRKSVDKLDLYLAGKKAENE